MTGAGSAKAPSARSMSPPPVPRRGPIPPALPPRNEASPDPGPPPPYTFHDETDDKGRGRDGVSRGSSRSRDSRLSRPSRPPYLSPDPRASSTQSLLSRLSSSDTRRTLLLVYIHGFYGNAQSFRSFPYHVHSFLRNALAESHVIHSKIYPRYKTYRAIEVARDNFSEWLRPHESPTTDVILIGHSMGGILSAEVVLMPKTDPASSHPFKHRILGTISLDSPFLGLHPGIIRSGLASLFQPDPKKKTTQQVQQDGGDANPTRRPPGDHLFDPPFFNDKPFKEAPFIKRITNFATKHRSEGLMNATAKHLMSHLEYGHCLVDFQGLKSRYNRVRALEDVDELKALNNNGVGEDKGPSLPSAHSSSSARVRFVNYYTLSPGRKEKSNPSTPGPSNAGGLTPTESRTSLLSRETSPGDGLTRTVSTASTMSITTNDFSADPLSNTSTFASGRTSLDNLTASNSDTNSVRSDMESMSLHEINPVPMSDDHVLRAAQVPGMPPLPELPNPPPDLDLEQISDRDARKQVERELERARKGYDRAVRDRNRAIRERQKLIEKLGGSSGQTLEEPEADGASKVARGGTDEESSSLVPNTVETRESTGEEGEPDPKLVVEDLDTAAVGVKEGSEEGPEDKKGKKKDKEAKKQKKFCTLPKSGGKPGEPDPTWVDVFMDGMDEVTAHCALFLAGPHYDRLVGDVASRVARWVEDDLTKRTVMEMERGLQ